jgi:predicted translin family RNA/ssDNA-binding protein
MITYYESTEFEQFRRLCREINQLSTRIVSAGQRSVALREIGKTLPQEHIEKARDEVSQLEEKLNEFGGWFPQFANGF